MKLTITEALAELKTIEKRIAAKRQYMLEHLVRPEQVKDPLEKDGGEVAVLMREFQGLTDLGTRVVNIRTAIQRTNLDTPVTVCGVTKMLAEWLTWRKEVAPMRQQFLGAVRAQIVANRKQWAAKPEQVAASPLLVNWDEAALAKEIELIETILGQLDGQLSLKNATVLVEIAE